jgi:hypothetical protein
MRLAPGRAVGALPRHVARPVAAEAQAGGAGHAGVPELRAQVAGALAPLLHAVTCHVAAAAALVASHGGRLEVVVEVPARGLMTQGLSSLRALGFRFWSIHGSRLEVVVEVPARGLRALGHQSLKPLGL